MGKAGAKGGTDRDSRLANALRDNLRRRKQASRPGDDPPAVERPNATPTDKMPEGGRGN